MAICRHPKKSVEICWSDEQKGYWASCELCEVWTACFPKKAKAMKALRKMKRQIVNTGSGPLGGRPKELPPDAKQQAWMLWDVHLQTIDKWKRKHKLADRAKAIRHLLENIEV